jgi:putative hydrolase of the HAD superfamily
VRPEEALHVGDSFREDYWGARQAGLKALLICRKGNGVQAAEHIRSLSGICRILKKEDGRSDL